MTKHLLRNMGPATQRKKDINLIFCKPVRCLQWTIFTLKGLSITNTANEI